MANCHGSITLSTNVDREMREFIEEEAEKKGVTSAEFLRRLFDVYRQSGQGELICAGCGEPVWLTGAM